MEGSYCIIRVEIYLSLYGQGQSAKVNKFSIFKGFQHLIICKKMAGIGKF